MEGLTTDCEKITIPAGAIVLVLVEGVFKKVSDEKWLKAKELLESVCEEFSVSKNDELNHKQLEKFRVFFVIWK